MSPLESPITIRGFQLIANLAMIGQGQALFSNSRPGNVAAQTLQLVTLTGFGRHTGVQGESSHVSNRGGVIGIIECLLWVYSVEKL